MDPRIEIAFLDHCLRAMTQQFERLPVARFLAIVAACNTGQTQPTQNERRRTH